MPRKLLLLCFITAAFGIIVKDPPPSPNDYKYSYDVHDPTTGDHKSQHEVRQGDVVTGAYVVVTPDGTKRTVEYTADAKHGFKAVINEEPGYPIAPIPPLVQHQIGNHHSNAIHSFGPKPSYVRVLLHKRNPIRSDRPIYFTPENEIQPQLPFENGHYFIPAHE